MHFVISAQVSLRKWSNYGWIKISSKKCNVIKCYEWSIFWYFVQFLFIFSWIIKIDEYEWINFCSSFMNNKRLTFLVRCQVWISRSQYTRRNFESKFNDANVWRVKTFGNEERLSTLSVKRFITLATEYFTYLTWKWYPQNDIPPFTWDAFWKCNIYWNNEIWFSLLSTR